MKVWIINHNAIPPQYGALVRHYYFGKLLCEKGDEVTIFTSARIHNSNINMCKDGSRYFEEIIDGIKYIYLKNVKYTGNGLDRILNMLEFAWKVGKIDKTFGKPDLIYASSPDIFAAISAQKMAKRLHIPFVLEIRDLWPESIVEVKKIPQTNPCIRLLYKMEKHLYMEAEKIIFTMPGGKNYICDKGWDKSVDLSKIFYINNGVDLEEFNRNLTLNRLDDPDLLSGKLKIIYCGSIRRANAVEQIIEAAKVIKRRQLDHIIFIMFGEGNEKRELEEIAKREELPIIFKGRVDRKYIPYILSCANLNLLNYINVDLLKKYGSSSNKLFEYITCGNPIVSNRTLMNDIITENGLGIAKDFSSAEEYADEMLKYLNLSEEERKLLREKSEKVIKEYDYARLSEKIYEVLHG